MYQAYQTPSAQCPATTCKFISMTMKLLDDIFSPLGQCDQGDNGTDMPIGLIVLFIICEQ